MSAPLRVGFAGAGFIAGVHAGILARDARVRVRAVFDTDARAAAVFAAKHGAPAASSVDDLLAAIDVLYICVPNALHAALAVRALDAGLHVFSEKPMATSLADAASVRDAAAAARGVYHAGFNRRFAPVYIALRRRIDEGRLAPLGALLKMNRGELRQPAWTGDAGISGGFLYETPVHILDLARTLLGEPQDVVCRARRGVYGQLDGFSMLLAFPAGVTAALTAYAHATWLYPFERVEIYGDHAIAATEEMDRVSFVEGARGPAETLDVAHMPFEERWGYVEEDRLFVDAVLGECAPPVTAADAYLTTQLVDRCYRAAGEAGAAT